MSKKYVDELGSTGIKAVGDQPLASRFDHGCLRFVDATYTMVGTEAANDTIKICDLKKGETVIPHLSTVSVHSDPAGASSTLDIGDDDGSGDADRYATAISIAAVANSAFDETTVDLHPVSEDCELVALFKVLNTPVAGGKLNFRVCIRTP
jgi:hypothetical protein